MSEKDRIKSLIKEAKIYRNQGLLEESEEKYQEILEKMKTLKKGPKNEAFIRSIQERIQDVRNEMDDIDKPSETPMLSDDKQQLITNLFAFSEDKETAAIEGAVALAEFGQYEGAITKFQELLDNGISPVMVAQNMIRCHLHLASPKAAIDQFKTWTADRIFSDKELVHLRGFYLDMLMARKKHGEPLEDAFIQEPDEDFFNTTETPSSEPDDPPKEPDGPPTEPDELDEPDEESEESVDSVEDTLEILSISIELMQEPGRERILEFEVTYQLGNRISFIVDSNDRDFTETFEPGTKLTQVHCFSPVSAFEASGVISEKKQITAGPRKGHYAFRMTLSTP